MRRPFQCSLLALVALMTALASVIGLARLVIEGQLYVLITLGLLPAFGFVCATVYLQIRREQRLERSRRNRRL
jgi:hypothetical protein